MQRSSSIRSYLSTTTSEKTGFRPLKLPPDLVSEEVKLQKSLSPESQFSTLKAKGKETQVLLKLQDDKARVWEGQMNLYQYHQSHQIAYNETLL